MAYLKSAEVDELILPSSTPEATYIVKMKRKASFGDQRAAQSAMLRINGQTGRVSDPEWDAYIGALLARLIVEWNVTDQNDNPLPVSVANIDLLDPEDGRFLTLEATKRTGQGGTAESGPFAMRSATG